MKILIIFLLFTVITLVISPAYASLSGSIGISLSKNCNTMLKNKFKTNCPGIEELVHLDNSNQKMSGGFKKIDGQMQREKSIYKNHYNSYRFDDKKYLFIDPPGDIINKVKMIIIETHLDTYIMQDQLVKVNDTRIISKDRYVDSCRIATIGADNWKVLLPDTITFLQHNCDPAFTKIDILKKINDNSTNQDISTTQKYKDEKYKQDAKKKYVKSKIGSNDKTKNPSVTEDKAPKYTPKVHLPYNYTKIR